jgi:hypothetical protein
MHRSKQQPSFDHLVGDGDKHRRDAEAEHPGGLGVDNQLELARLAENKKLTKKQRKQIGRELALAWQAKAKLR